MKTPEQRAFETITEIHEKSERIASTIATEWQRVAFEKLTARLIADELAKVTNLEEQPEPTTAAKPSKSKLAQIGQGITFNPFSDRQDAA